MKATCPHGPCPRTRAGPVRLAALEPADEVAERDDLRDALVAVLALARRVVLEAAGDDHCAGLDLDGLRGALDGASSTGRPSRSTARSGLGRRPPGGVEHVALERHEAAGRCARLPRLFVHDEAVEGRRTVATKLPTYPVTLSTVASVKIVTLGSARTLWTSRVTTSADGSSFGNSRSRIGALPPRRRRALDERHLDAGARQVGGRAQPGDAAADHDRARAWCPRGWAPAAAVARPWRRPRRPAWSPWRWPRPGRRCAQLTCSRMLACS